MSDSPTPPAETPPSPTTREELEKEKLRIEIERLKLEGSPFRLPRTWFAALGSLAALGGIGLQYIFSSLDYKEARIQRAEAQLDVKVAREELQDVNSRIALAREEDRKLREQLEKANAEIEESFRQRDEMVSQLSQIPAPTLEPMEDAVQVVGRAIDEQGQPIAGAEVTAFRDGVVVGRNITGADGRYRLEVPKNELLDSIVFGTDSQGTAIRSRIMADQDKTLDVTIPRKVPRFEVPDSSIREQLIREIQGGRGERLPDRLLDPGFQPLPP